MKRVTGVEGRSQVLFFERLINSVKLTGSSKMIAFANKRRNNPSVSTTLRQADYEQSKNNNTKGLRLYEYIISRDNILLAYRNIKANPGSKQQELTVPQYNIENVDEFIKGI
ncbi:hypothetical protein [Neobacillus vireti]|uniref:hypothetical protein n=1 Tax=Neobacillus vireti TaxID=220686 RepID=UPI002FFF09C4